MADTVPYVIARLKWQTAAAPFGEWHSFYFKDEGERSRFIHWLEERGIKHTVVDHDLITFEEAVRRIQNGKSR